MRRVKLKAMSNPDFRITISVDPETLKTIEDLTAKLSLAAGLDWDTGNDMAQIVHQRFSAVSDSPSLAELAQNLQRQANRMKN